MAWIAKVSVASSSPKIQILPGDGTTPAHRMSDRNLRFVGSGLGATAQLMPFQCKRRVIWFPDPSSRGLLDHRGRQRERDQREPRHEFSLPARRPLYPGDQPGAGKSPLVELPAARFSPVIVPLTRPLRGHPLPLGEGFYPCSIRRCRRHRPRHILIAHQTS